MLHIYTRVPDTCIVVGCVLPHTETRDAASGNRMVLEEFINSL